MSEADAGGRLELLMVQPISRVRLFAEAGAGLAAAAAFAVVAAWFANSIGAVIPALEPLRAASPFRWADASIVLLHGPEALRPLGTSLAAAAVALLGALLFRRRGGGGGRARRPETSDPQVGLDLAAVDRDARPRGVARVHRVERALRGRHGLGGLEELDHHRGALVRVVEDLDPDGGDVHGRGAVLDPGQVPGEVIGVDVREPDDARVHGLSFRSPRGERIW
jgi:hypothetical protein